MSTSVTFCGAAGSILQIVHSNMSSQSQIKILTRKLCVQKRGVLTALNKACVYQAYYYP